MSKSGSLSFSRQWFSSSSREEDPALDRKKHKSLSAEASSLDTEDNNLLDQEDDRSLELKAEPHRTSPWAIMTTPANLCKMNFDLFRIVFARSLSVKCVCVMCTFGVACSKYDVFAIVSQ